MNCGVAVRALLVVTLCCTAFLRRASAADPSPLSGDTVIARVGQTPYTLADVRRRLERLEPPYRHAAEQELPEFVRDFVQHEALAREASRLGLENDPDVRAQIEEATQAILIRALFKHEVTARAMPSPEAVKAHYREHQEEFQIPEQVEADQILVTNEEKARAIRTAAVTGQSFAVVAESQGVERVDVTTFPRGMREPEVETAVFALAVGEISQPVRTHDGVYLFRLRARHPARVQSLEGATAAIQARLASQNQERLWKDLKDRLWSGDNVMIREDLLKAAIPRESSASAGQQSSPASTSVGTPKKK